MYEKGLDLVQLALFAAVKSCFMERASKPANSDTKPVAFIGFYSVPLRNALFWGQAQMKQVSGLSHRPSLRPRMTMAFDRTMGVASPFLEGDGHDYHTVFHDPVSLIINGVRLFPGTPNGYHCAKG